jgi:hypothetical protein
MIVMSNVLSFPVEKARRFGRELRPDEARGEIRFFTGVRIERHHDADSGETPSASDGASRGRRRKA